ncbi:hypothetical protein [Methylocystis parvus]|uniref:DUF3617 family protein n=1 Tax=Methylocystis parvus TaxID=134 RepID=A0A6B8M4X5_9HYPH|nr:hypothetical protein [Methylocystis parvus]QGM96393.1 hypothetical protein F7D14_02090 [Methylocystis parvus]WBJ99764.1 hypothetical protein MMG94_17535 [Methylocystis parvus OBBP]
MKTVFAKWAAVALASSLVAQDVNAWEMPKVGMPEMLGGSKDGAATPGATADCPVIVIEDGGQIRSPVGADAASVHHQVSIKSTARECIVDGGNITIKIGVEGDAMLGPAGAPGSYGGTIRVALRRTKDDSIVVTRNYRVSASIPGNAARADFRLLPDPIAFPATAKAQEEYEILIGFTDGAASDGADKPVGKKKKGRR